MRSPTANRASIPRSIVWIVDAHRSDYGHLLADVKSEQLEIHFLSSGRELLHCWFTGAPDVCIVNLQLPELNGFDIIEMIRPFPEGTAVCLLADKYVLEDEIRALSLGVHSYLCKPLEARVFFKFCLCLRAKRETAVRAAASPSARL
jgi:DNA-binding response OmpR family regulator